MEPLVMDIFAQPMIDSLHAIFPSIGSMYSIEIDRVIKSCQGKLRDSNLICEYMRVII